jgi:aminoglycoside phosphotransferase (APT) family kinase protein
MPQMHPDELPIDDALVRHLLQEQFPHLADLPLARVEPWGTVHAIYRLGDGLSLRLPRRLEWSDEEHLVALWLPRLAPALPLAVPVPVAEGAPADGYACHWSVCTWIEGETGVDAPWDPLTAADTLASFVRALRQIESDGAPPLRDRLAYRSDDMRAVVAQVGSDALAIWEAALEAPTWNGPAVWCHADLDARNWLVRGGRLHGIIDWEGFGAGDPAADVMAAWKLHSAEAAKVFRDALGVDDATWLRARGWAISQAAAALGYYTLDTNPSIVREAQLWLELAVSDSE